jgi:PAS domain S-box-containing protein
MTIGRRVAGLLTRCLAHRPFLPVLALLFLCPCASAAGLERRHVLLVFGAEKDLPMNLLVDRQLRATFRAKLNDGVELYSEYLDVSRFPDKGYPRKLLEFLHDKYSGRGLDLIVVVDASALDLVQLDRDWFFPATPIVFCCITEAAYKARTIQAGVTGIPAKMDYAPTLEVALKVHPGTRHVVVITGASEVDAKITAEARRDFRPLEGRVEFRYLIGLPMTDLRQEVARLSGDTIIIHLSIFQDGAGKFFIPRDALEQVVQAARVPVYGYYDSYLGHGIVGGFLASFEIEATNAARLGLRILAGEKPGEIPIAEATPCAYLFDWRQLKRWGVDEERLPPGSDVRFREPSFWDLYRWHIVGVLALCVVQAVLILGLLVQRTRGRRAEKERQRAEEELRESEARFRLMADAAPVLIWVSGPDKGCTYFNKPWLAFTGRPLERELCSGWTEGVHPDDLARCLEVYTTHFDGRRPFEMEYRLRRHDGVYRWILDQGVPRFTSDGEFAGYIGACIDVTDRKRAVEQLRVTLEQQRDLASRLLRAQEVERRRLAREMHDDLTQRLAVMAIEIGKLERQLDLPGAVAEALRSTGDQLVKLSEDVHALSRQMHPSILDDLGLVDALRSECVHFQQREGIAVSYQPDNVPAGLPRDTALCLYRIAQEALRNVVRHAGTGGALVSLIGYDGEVLLTISDGGKGFDPADARPRPGLGLASMEERARLIGAELSVASHPGKGTTISVLVPRGG